MNHFWKYARMLLEYKSLLALAAVGALIDALALGAGIGGLLLVIDTLLVPDGESGLISARELIRDKLSDPEVVQWIGNRSDLAQIIPADPWSGFAFIVGGIFLLAVIGSIGRYIHEYNVITVVLRMITALRKRMFSHVMHLPMATVTSEGISDKLSRIVKDTSQLKAGLNAMMGRAVRDILQGVVFLTAAVVVNAWLTGIFVLGTPIVVLLIRRFGRRIRKATKRALASYAVMFGKMNEALQSLRVVKVHQGEGYERRHFAAVNRRVLRQEMRSRAAKALSAPVIELVGIAGVIGVALIAAWVIFRRGEEPADLAKVLLLLGAAAGALKPLTGLNNDLQEASAAAERLDQTLNLTVEPPAALERKTGTPALPRHRESVRFENVWFTYPTASTPALRGVNLHVPFGSVCAVVGGNGSGKSTLLSLIPRLYSPGEGRVLIDGIDIAGRSLRSLRRQMALVAQDTVLFDGTIADNIAYGARHATRQRVEEAARRAHAHEFIANLPAAYDTQIGEWGSRLSGGQRQRLAIARAILRDPAILILDEATSQIDTDSEAKITAALAEFMRDRTTFVIAHRLSTVVHADMIVVMVDGAISAIGKHRELLASSDVYRTLCRTQLVEEDAPDATASAS